jgi:hypothetical protein
MKGAARAAAISTWAYQAGQEEVLSKVAADGVTVHQADPAVIAKTAEFAAADRTALVGLYADKGVTRGEEMLTAFQALLEKWVGLTQGITGADALADLYWSELYSKVDVATHGN